MKTLQILSSAYRATAEEQDDTILWFTQAMAGAGGEFSVLLSGNAVNYAVSGQDASGLRIGDWEQSQPPRLARDIQQLLDKGIDVYLLADDAIERGLADDKLIAGTRRLKRAELPDFLNDFARVWSW